ncbi:hypothetical protein AMS68_001568 [Peltaster fructicola]|uniref:Mediator of RNA polymerase II transcription subunit 10 n=1 Tax=Peltaster fructicola TaxID=286661 RepID=A0A6H0XN28_9PEZI|nr:hypothetical protein AMS68_001568 [Peltaster fructicola]
MAATLDEADTQLKLIISNLYHLMVQTHDYEGPSTQQAMTAEIKRFVRALIDLTRAGQQTSVTVPIDLIDFVEKARNPDIYTRQFVEEAMRLNQELKGRTEAFAEFRDILGQEMMSAIPDIKEQIRHIMLATNSKVVT